MSVGASPGKLHWSNAGRWLRSSHLRFIGLILLLELLFGGALMLSVTHLIRADLDAADSALAEQLQEDLTTVAREQGVRGLSDVISARIATDSDEVILLSDAQGRKIAGNLNSWPPVVPVVARWTPVDLYRIGDALPGSFGIVATKLPGGARLLSGQRIDESTQVRETVKSAMATALWLALPLALAGAWLVVHIIDLRVDRIVQTAAGVRAGDIGRRVPLDGSGDSFDQLGGAINGMLDQISTLLSELRLLTDSMAHDLRSPLTRLRARIDRAVLAQDADAMRKALDGVSREADQLLGMLTTALEISRAEAGIGRDRFAPVDLAATLTDLAELYEPLVEDAGRSLTLAVQARPIVEAHRELLGQAISNLIDNALKYGAGRLTLSLSTDAAMVIVGLSDEGIGIAEERREEAVRRFGRLDAARSEGGAGLGLSLVSAVAQLHGGALRFAGGEGLFTVELHLPK